jgi:peroxisomal 2,4-dienoyl-CoA reductase
VRGLVHLGANACIVGRNVEKTESVAKSIATERRGAKVLGIGSVDVRSVESLTAAVERCVKELGGVDILIAGAAGNFLAPMTQLSPNAFKSVIDIDVLGSYNVVKACMPHLFESAKRGKTPRIIFISATIHYTGMPLQTHVMAAKAAVDALSSSCAIELGPRGITSNVISPGAIAGTEGVDRLIRKEDMDAASKRTPMGRVGTVKDITDATVWLCSEGGAFINGTIMVGKLYHDTFGSCIYTNK